MNGLEVAAIITAIGGFVAVVGGLFVNARKIEEVKERDRAEMDDLKAEIEKLKRDGEDSRRREEFDKRDIILIGEQLAGTRADASKLALLINQLFNQYKAATGQAPDVDVEMIAHMREIYYITGRLPAIDVEAVKKIQ